MRDVAGFGAVANRQPAAPPAVLPITRDLSFAFLITRALIGLLILCSVGGLLAGVRWYDATASTYPAFLAQDIVTLVLAVPLLAGTARRARAGSLRGLIGWMGTLFYLAYSYYFYVAGAPFNPLFPVYIAIVSMSAYGAVFLLFSTDAPIARTRFRATLPVRAIATFLMALAVGFACLWIALVGASVVTGRDLDLVSRTVIALDGVILLPLLFVGGLWLWRREPIGYLVAGLLLVKTTITFVTLLVATAMTAAWGFAVDPGQTAAFAVSLLVGGLLLAHYLRALDGPTVSLLRKGTS